MGLFASKAGAVDRKLRIVHGTEDPPTFAFPDGDDCERFKAHLSPIVARNKEKAAAAAPPLGGGEEGVGISEAQPAASPGKDAGPGSSHLRAAGAQRKGLNKNELKAAVLLRSPELARLHANLVRSGHITEAEFWDSREHLILAEAAAESQRRGKNGLIVDPRPVRDESGNATMRLTNEMIEDIFEEFPVVRRAYDENVPKKINDQQFWSRYVKSKLASRNSASARGAASEHTVQDDAIFDKYLEKEDDGKPHFQPRHQMGPVSEKLIDLDATAEDHPETGNNQDITMQAGKQRQALPLIRRFNEHSQRLLDSALGSEPPSKRRRLTPVDGNEDADNDYIDQIIIDDLQAPPSTVGIPLEMRDRQKYFEGSRAVDSGTASTLDDSDTVDVPAVLPVLLGSVREWANDMTNMRLDKKASEDALSKMTHSVRARLDVKSRRSDFPDDIVEEMTSLQTATTEFLRQFWSAIYPPPPEQGLLSVASPQQLSARAEKMVKYLAKTQGKVSALVQKGAQLGMDARRIDATFAPTLTAVDKALLTQRARTGP
ncbi:RNA polymerase II transcription factor B subunit 1 [Tulasnella sp. 330]|nr:RNA polymerase II transcription factor B subunit 1 [Tulasnella sp. 330]KAG8890462.1 RNA polymerase II transcription factor B subunit 1 [Tulasnella sp. 332]